jgi:GNAT superfamily N-acetyltransferase
VFRIERRGPELFARRVSAVAIFPCEGGRDEASEQALAAAFDKGGAERVTRLYGATICRKTNVGCARRAGVWLTVDATDIFTSGSPGSRRRPSDHCFRSKAVWGYDPEFMALMPAALEVAGEDIIAGNVWIATGADEQIAGVVALASSHAPGTLDLNKLFVEPRRIRGGVGRALLAHAVAEARQRGAERLTILADPNAAGFYERNGAVRIGEAPSDAVPGRLLPLYELRLYPAG